LLRLGCIRLDFVQQKIRSSRLGIL
jgi:hypothetical protein